MRQEITIWKEYAESIYKKNSIVFHKLFTIFVLAVIIAWPMYTSNVFAQVTITENHGEAGVEGFLDAAGDVWTLGVNIAGETQVNPGAVKVNGFFFNNCVPGVSGVDCRYEFDFRGSSIFAMKYDINIETPVGSATDKVIAEFQSPRISDLEVKQQGSDVEVSFSVQDFPEEDCVGLGSVEIFDDQDNLLLSLIGDDLSGIVTGCAEGDVSLIIPSGRTGTTTFVAKVVARDRLGHSFSVFSNPLEFDLTAPTILPDSFKLGDLENIVAAGRAQLPIKIKVIEDGDSLEASITSSDASISQTQTECSFLGNETFLCEWSVTADLPSTKTYEFDLETVDGGGNRRSITLSQNIIADGEPPVVVRFGGLREFQGETFVKRSGAVIIAEFEQDQAGIEPQDIFADLSALNAFLTTRRPADRCEKGQTVRCFWDDIDVTSGGYIFLTEAEDNVSNRADVSGVSVFAILDETNPIITDVRVQGVLNGEIQPFVKSRDSLQIEFTVNDLHGAFAHVNISEVVHSGPDLVPATCQETSEDIWHCTATTQPVKSGPDMDAQIIVEVEDAAGNLGVEAAEFEILGIDGDTDDPDFWRVSSMDVNPEGVDADAFAIAPQRLFFTVNLIPTGSSVQMLNTNLLSCTSDPRIVSQPRMLNNGFGSVSPTLMVEVFDPSVLQQVSGGEEPSFDPISINCTIGIFTRRGNEVIRVAEQESVELEAKFFRSGVSADLLTLDDKIEKLEDRVDSGFFGLIGDLTKILQWVDIICGAIGLIELLYTVWLALDSGPLQVMSDTVYGTASADAACAAGDSAEASSNEIVEYLQILCSLATCNPDAVKGTWYSTWQNAVLQYYNILSGKALVLGEYHARSVTNLQDNLVISVVGLCLPGVIKNLNKLRQVDCVYLDCLKNTVPAGVATMEGCRELRDYMECKYIWGEVFQIIPFVGAADYLLDLLQNILKDPVGLVRMILVLACTPECATAPALDSACGVVTVGVFLIDLADQVLGIVQTFELTTEGDYCDIALADKD